MGQHNPSSYRWVHPHSHIHPQLEMSMIAARYFSFAMEGNSTHSATCLSLQASNSQLAANRQSRL